ncbi:MAG TPA: low temperature requirement protein A [Candidatus Limnocylindria bacterium]|nr:low temperature requirement protein A [Candidatus Limnocylindria bacterium]
MTPPRWHVPMDGRDPDESHRAATPLELLFDLCFVVAVAQAAIVLHHEIAAIHVLSGIIGFAMVFFAIWWAWMNFTWFASAYDTDDVLYRLLTFVQMGGVLVIAAGIAEAYEHGDYLVVTIGYGLMRVALIAQWLRASVEDPRCRNTARRYALGIALVQVGWFGRLLLPTEVGIAAFVPLVVLELLVPVWAERSGEVTPWHGGHIAERYGLFTIIVLGEVVLAATTAVQEAIGEAGLLPELIVLAVGGLVLIAAMWWAYFKHDAAEDELTQQTAFVWGYGHYFIFAFVAATGAGIQVVADLTHEEAAITASGAALAVAIPVIGYLVVAGLVTNTGRSERIFGPLLIASGLVLVAALVVGPWSPFVAVLLMGLAVSGAVIVSVRRTAGGVEPGGG